MPYNFDNSVYDKGIKILEGQIEKVHFIDDTTNTSGGKFVQYDVSVRESHGGQSLFTGIPRISLVAGGTNDFDETILEPNDIAFVGKQITSNRFINKNGTKVLVAFINANYANPVIIGTMQHPKLDGTTRAEGISKKGEYRGLEYSIDKEGAFTLTYNGDRDPAGEFTRSETSGTTINIDNEGILTVSDNEGNLIKIDRVAKSVEITSKENTEHTVGKDHNVTVTGSQTNTITEDQTNEVTGDQTNTVTGDQTNTITGDQVDTITGEFTGNVTGNWTLAVNGNTTVNTTGTLLLTADQMQAIINKVVQIIGSSVQLGAGLGLPVARIGDPIVAGILPGIIVGGSGIVTAS
jgi:hypothetical protein